MTLGFLPRLADDGWRDVPGLSMNEGSLAAVCLISINIPEIGNHRGSGTGFLIAPRVVCTAAHVVNTASRGPGLAIGPDWLRCLWGRTVNIGGETPTVRLPRPNRVVDVRINPGYITRPLLDYTPATANLSDVALVLLAATPEKVDGVTPLPIGIGSVSGAGAMAMAVGYGPSEAERDTNYRHRRSGAAYVTHSTETVIVTRYPATAGYEYAGQTSGDSGGPLIVPSSSGLPMAVGVVSGHRVVTAPQTFEFYSKLDAARSWIESVMAEWGSSTESSDRPGSGETAGGSILPWLIGGAAVLGVAALLAFGGRK